MKGKNIKIRGEPEEEGGILRAYNVHLLEDDEVVPRVQQFKFEVDAMSGVPLVTIVQYPGMVDFELKGVQVNKEIASTRIFDECTEILKTMDYDFRLALKKKGISWKNTDPEVLKGHVDKCHESLTTIMEQYKKGERDILDITLFATKLANYCVLLADRTHTIHTGEKGEKENGNESGDSVQKS